jgi:hypothetical protein
MLRSRLSRTSEGVTGADSGRRSLLTFCVRAALAVAFANARIGAASDCTDPDDLSGADVALRKSVEYTESSSDDKKHVAVARFSKPVRADAVRARFLAGA